MLRSVLRGVVTLVIAAIMIFVVMDVLPGDAATQSLGPTADPEQLSRRRSELGLDRPLWTRLSEWLLGLFSGDLGHAASSKQPLVELIGPAMRNTLILTSFTIPLVMLIGIAGGLYAGLHAGSHSDKVLSTTAQAFISVPDFAIATLMVVVLAAQWELVPQVSLVRPNGSPLDTPEILIIPALTLGLAAGTWLLRMVRAVVADAAALPHIKCATLAGVSPLVVLFRHTLPVVVAPIAQFSAATVPYLLSGAVVVESVVGYPGVGGLLTGLVSQRDTAAVASLTVVLAALTLLVFSIADRQRKPVVTIK